MNKKKQKVPTLLAISVLIVGIAAGTVLVSRKNIFRLEADVTLAPQAVTVSNVSDRSVTVSWTTKTEAESFLSWGESTTAINNNQEDGLSENGYLHSVTIESLAPSSTYYFTINSQGAEFDNNGTAWEISTAPSLNLPPEISPISGTVVTASGIPAANVLVYAQVAGAGLISTTTSSEGNWVLPLSTLRNTPLNAYFQINEAADLINISVQAGPLGISSAQIYATGARPAPPLILGQVHDYTQVIAGEEGELPEVELNAPADVGQKDSRFEVPDKIATPSATIVTLESVDEGEVVYSQNPEFFGEGPPGTEITITVESTPVTDGVTVDASGEWSWSPPLDLEEGEHTVTISFLDANGIINKITKTFIVQAAENPAFEATPSATPTFTPTSTPTPVSTISAAPVPQPDSGIPLPTILMLILGIGTFTTGIYLSLNKNQES